MMENDLGVIIAICSMCITFIAAMVVLFLWTRAESRADSRHMDNKLELYRTETNSLIKAIHDEMKDFHARLVVIEEKKIKILEK